MNHGLPSAGGHARVAPRKVGFGDLAVERGLTESLVLGVDDLLGGITVLRLQAKASAGFGIDAIELSGALTAIDQTETVLHRLSSSLEEK